MSEKPFALGALRSPKDERDHAIERYLPAPMAAAPLPTSLDLRSRCQKVRNQGQEGTCVAHALASGVLGYDEHAGPDRVLSVRDAYQGARMIQPINGEGSYPRAALEYARKAGVCLESDWPYNAGNVGTPGANAEHSRPLNKALAYAAVNRSQEDIKRALCAFGPLLVSIAVRDGFYNPGSLGRVTLTGAVHGLHAVTLVGYDDARGCYLLRNSWGEGWGDMGYAWMPYYYPLEEAWSVIPAILNEAPPTPPAPPAPVSEPFWVTLLRLFHLG